jgi:septal ring factor EnvC (AmiA/AmiB activator)
MLGATLCSAVAPAGADATATATASLQEQAAELSQQMMLEQLQIGGFQQQRAAYMGGVAADDAQLRELETRLAVMRHRIGADRAELRNAAVKAYVEGGTQADGMSALFADTPSENASTVYTQVMNADLTSAADRLQSNLRALRTEEATEQHVSVQARRLLNGADTALDSARSAEEELAQQRVSVTGELAIAQEQAAQEQADEATQEAAARAASVSDAPASGPSTAPAAPAASTGALPPLNSFLRCVVQAESGGDYQAVSPTGQYMGAFQFAQPTWNEAAGLAGIPTLVGVPPYQASMRDQDLLAIALYDADGEQPWYDPCTT